jgi:hypothetical protein
MKKSYWWFMVVIVFVAGLMISNMLVQAKENTPVIKWEYKTVRVRYINPKYAAKEVRHEARILNEDVQMLNENGKDGWELCGVNKTNYFFKRKIKE